MMKKPDTILDEIHATRCKIDERTKDMTPTERTEYFNQRGAEAAKNTASKSPKAQREHKVNNRMPCK